MAKPHSSDVDCSNVGLSDGMNFCNVTNLEGSNLKGTVKRFYYDYNAQITCAVPFISYGSRCWDDDADEPEWWDDIDSLAINDGWDDFNSFITTCDEPECWEDSSIDSLTSNDGIHSGKYETSDELCAAIYDPTNDSVANYPEESWKCSCKSEDGDAYSYSCTEKCEYCVKDGPCFRKTYVGMYKYEEEHEYLEHSGGSCYEYEYGSHVCNVEYYDAFEASESVDYDVSKTELWVNGQACPSFKKIQCDACDTFEHDIFCDCVHDDMVHYQVSFAADCSNVGLSNSMDFCNGANLEGAVEQWYDDIIYYGEALDERICWTDDADAPNWWVDFVSINIYNSDSNGGASAAGFWMIALALVLVF
jgi:hypothetical protein